MMLELHNTTTHTLNYGSNNANEKYLIHERKEKHESHDHDKELITVYHDENGSSRVETNSINIKHFHGILYGSLLSVLNSKFEASDRNERKFFLEEAPSSISSFENSTVGWKRNYALVETAGAFVPDKAMCPILYITNTDDVSITLTKIKQMKHVALMKAYENDWKESHDILQNIYEIERKMYFCRKKRCSLLDLSDTLFYLGLSYAQLGRADLALQALHESLSFRQQKLVSDDVGALITQSIAMITGVKTY